MRGVKERTAGRDERYFDSEIGRGESARRSVEYLRCRIFTILGRKKERKL